MTEIPDPVKLVILGAAAGVLSGLFGIGGGLVIVPALVLPFDLDIKTATGTSLFVILLPTGLLGVLEYHKNGHLKVVRRASGLPSAFSAVRISGPGWPGRFRPSR